MITPKSFRGSRLAGLVAAAAALSVGSARPVSAVIGGAESASPPAGSAVMVLTSRGGMCSGVVIAPDVVLTAGHCVAGTAETRIHFKGPDGAPVLIAPSARALHPGYDPGAIAGRRRSIDLALVRSSEPLPGRFAPATLSADMPRKGDAVALGGYGLAQGGDPRSTGTFRSAALGVVEPYGPSRILLWLAGAGRAGACEGDSGGPVALPGGAGVAVTSGAAGSGGRDCGAMSQAVLLGPQRDWIDRIAAAWSREPAWR